MKPNFLQNLPTKSCQEQFFPKLICLSKDQKKLPNVLAIFARNIFAQTIQMYPNLVALAATGQNSIR